MNTLDKIRNSPNQLVILHSSRELWVAWNPAFQSGIMPQCSGSKNKTLLVEMRMNLNLTGRYKQKKMRKWFDNASGSLVYLGLIPALNMDLTLLQGVPYICPPDPIVIRASGGRIFLKFRNFIQNMSWEIFVYFRGPNSLRIAIFLTDQSSFGRSVSFGRSSVSFFGRSVNFLVDQSVLTDTDAATIYYT
jgi:hypothetical protein